MKIFGHPIHSMLIHFPTALLPMDLILSFLAYKNGTTSFTLAAFYCLAAGVLSGYLAMLIGLLDLIRIPKTNKPALGNGLIHGFLNFTVILVYRVLAWKGYKAYPNLESPTRTLIIFKAILIGALLAGNYSGGTLVYKYLIGTHQTDKHD
ncbi:MAG: hypothetical protein C4330_09905 [Chitinophagaceae bacterium]